MNKHKRNALRKQLRKLLYKARNGNSVIGSMFRNLGITNFVKPDGSINRKLTIEFINRVK